MNLLLVRPTHFGFNPETALSNRYQQAAEVPPGVILAEFQALVDVLQQAEIPHLVVQDTPEPPKPDAVFPNNWMSAHPDGTVVLYPMMAPSRRHERRTDILESLSHAYEVSRVIDLTFYEAKGQFLEGTGSLVFDHAAKTVLACSSARTSEAVLDDLCARLGYQYLFFHAVDEDHAPIYHTNVMLWMGKTVAALCLDSIRSETEQDWLLDFFERTQRKVIALSQAQVRAFAGNAIEVFDRVGRNYFLMSESARHSLHPGQADALELFGDFLTVSIPTLQRIGGGGVRCMVADIHLPPRH
ncbi:MAG: arginine deiminase-related protein [Cyclobacteriaceae bacterium]|jgi:hypothetical protein|nr:arginine deiminase-related protein [Cyclobacteriaceae bacterium]